MGYGDDEFRAHRRGARTRYGFPIAAGGRDMPTHPANPAQQPLRKHWSGGQDQQKPSANMPGQKGKVRDTQGLDALNDLCRIQSLTKTEIGIVGTANRQRIGPHTLLRSSDVVLLGQLYTCVPHIIRSEASAAVIVQLAGRMKTIEGSQALREMAVSGCDLQKDHKFMAAVNTGVDTILKRYKDKIYLIYGEQPPITPDEYASAEDSSQNPQSARFEPGVR